VAVISLSVGAKPCDFERPFPLVEGPDASSPVPSLFLSSIEPVVILNGFENEEMCCTHLQEFLVDQDIVGMNIREQAMVMVFTDAVPFQHHVTTTDQFFIPHGGLLCIRLSMLGRIDSKVPDMTTVDKDYGISIEDPCYLERARK